MPRIHSLAVLLALGLAAGCKAQPAPPPSVTPQAVVQGLPQLDLNRRIEVMVRSQFNLPQDMSLTIGARKPSQIPGYDTLPITLGHGPKQSVIDFLISADSKTLAHLDTFSLDKDPLFSIDIAGRPIRGTWGHPAEREVPWARASPWRPPENRTPDPRLRHAAR